jgi:hypothetical protein
MNDFRPSFEREAGQVTLQGPPASAAGEALLTPVPGLDLAFDRVDGHLCRAVVDVAETGRSVVVDEEAAALLSRLFGQEAPGVSNRSLPERSPAWRVSPRPGPPVRYQQSRPGGRQRPPNSLSAADCGERPASRPILRRPPREYPS